MRSEGLASCYQQLLKQMVENILLQTRRRRNNMLNKKGTKKVLYWM